MPRKSALERVSRSMLYFIRAGDFVKIGQTTDLDGRIKTLQCGCPLEIEEAVGIPGRGIDESRWHSRFKDKRVRGEWFQWCPEIEDAMKAEIVAARRNPSPLRRGENYGAA